MCHRNETGECGNGRSMGCACDVTVVPRELIFDTVRHLFSETLGSVLDHAVEYHGHGSTSMRKDETNILESRKRTGEQQAYHGPGGVVRHLGHDGWDTGH